MTSRFFNHPSNHVAMCCCRCIAVVAVIVAKKSVVYLNNPDVSCIHSLRSPLLIGPVTRAHPAKIMTLSIICTLNLNGRFIRSKLLSGRVMDIIQSGGLIACINCINQPFIYASICCFLSLASGMYHNLICL